MSKMDEEFPSNFDVIILGTGMPESILAAAVARSGKTVLHLDISDHYGGDWASFNFDQLREWTSRASKVIKGDGSSPDEFSDLKKDDEKFLIIPHKSDSVFNVKVNEYVPQSIVVYEDSIVNVSVTENITPVKVLESDDKDIEIETESNDADIEVKTENVEPVLKDSAKAADISNLTAGSPLKQENDLKKAWSLEDLHTQRRKFNLDLAPKLLFSRGALVELLIQSNISRYAEFKCSSQILTLLENTLVPVPCSRADVFSTKHVSIVEKRMLMKLLKFCLEFEDHPEEYKDFETKPFIKFLNSKKLTKNIEHYLIHSIAMVDPNTPTLESLKQVRKFLQSLGLYGNSPFLFPLYGSGEMPQCFCRLCAVFGGIYCLKQTIQALILNSEGECIAGVVNGKRIECKAVAMESSYSPIALLPDERFSHRVSKAIFITDAPVYPSENDQLTFLRLPQSDLIGSAVNVLELGPSSNVCPVGLRVVYLSCLSIKDTSEEDLFNPAQSLLNFTKLEEADTEIKTSKPNVVWALYFNQYDNTWFDLNQKAPKNVFLLPTSDIEQDYENAIEKAKEVFLKLFPTEEFLPRAPDPEEIILDSGDIENNSENVSDVKEKDGIEGEESKDATGDIPRNELHVDSTGSDGVSIETDLKKDASESDKDAPTMQAVSTSEEFKSKDTDEKFLQPK